MSFCSPAAKTENRLRSSVFVYPRELCISAKIGVDVFSETFEEELQNFLEPTFRSIIFGEEYNIPTIDEMIETAIVSAGTTLLLGGSDTVSRDLSANKLLNATTQMANGKTNTPYNQEDIVKRLKDKGFNPEKSADMAEVIAARLNGQELTRTQKYILSSALNSSAVQDVITDISTLAQGTVLCAKLDKQITN